jgi:hypothetical protein
MVTRMVSIAITSAACLIFLAGCVPLAPSTPAGPVATGQGLASSAAPTGPGFAVFPAGAIPDYQLGGAYDPPPGVTVVTRDSTQPVAAGMYSICYINGFQTQPGVAWPDDLLIHNGDGLLVDPNWPDEHVIDISTSAKRAAAASRQFASIDSCAAAGYAAVEFDNLDSYTRAAEQLSLDDAVAFATLLVHHAHKAGLAAGQKNTGELGTRGRDQIGFDFAVTEECDQFLECAGFTDVYGARLIDIEYTDALRRPFAAVCSDATTPRSTILRDRKLTLPGSSDYAYEHC